MSEQQDSVALIEGQNLEAGGEQKLAVAEVGDLAPPEDGLIVRLRILARQSDPLTCDLLEEAAAAIDVLSGTPSVDVHGYEG